MRGLLIKVKGWGAGQGPVDKRERLGAGPALSINVRAWVSQAGPPAQKGGARSFTHSPSALQVASGNVA